MAFDNVPELFVRACFSTNSDILSTSIGCVSLISAFAHILIDFSAKNSVIQIFAFAFGTLLLAGVSLKFHLCSSSISASPLSIYVGIPRIQRKYVETPQIQRKIVSISKKNRENVGISKINRKTIAEF